MLVQGIKSRPQYPGLTSRYLRNQSRIYCRWGRRAGDPRSLRWTRHPAQRSHHNRLRGDIPGQRKSRLSSRSAPGGVRPRPTHGHHRRKEARSHSSWRQNGHESIRRGHRNPDWYCCSTCPGIWIGSDVGDDGTSRLACTPCSVRALQGLHRRRGHRHSQVRSLRNEPPGS